jgi:hypothetical protein
MTSRHRETLKNFFAEGRMPTSDHFRDLIDSTLNMTDEGFRKSEHNGLEISTPVGFDALLSFYRDQDPQSVVWSTRYGTRDQLQFNFGATAATPDMAPVLTLDGGKQAVGINTTEPQHALDVGGVIGAQGRIGRYPLARDASLPANGQWQNLTDELQGCQAFEVVAGVGGRQGGGRYSLLHAIALNTYNPDPGWFDLIRRKRPIRVTCAYYGRRCDRLELRWVGDHGRDCRYRLQVRSRCEYEEGVSIKAQLTRLWFDEDMQGAAK